MFAPALSRHQATIWSMNSPPSLLPPYCDSAASKRIARILSCLLGLFCCRVAGQLLVTFVHVQWLPPSEEWYSGLMDYPALVACQLAIICIFAKVCYDFHRGKGYFIERHSWMGKPLLRFGLLYLFSMMLRYCIRMVLYAAERWAGGCIPIIFHCVLAAFVIVVGWYHWWRQACTEVPRIDSCPKTRSRPFSSMLAWGGVATGLITWVGYQVAPSLCSTASLRPSHNRYAVRIEKQHVVTNSGKSTIVEIYKPVRTSMEPPMLTMSSNHERSPIERLKLNITARSLAEQGFIVTSITDDSRFLRKSGTLHK